MTAEAILEDAELIQRSRRDPAAFGALFDRHAPALHRYVTRRLGDSLADDVVADTFLAAFRRRDRYDARHPNARPWLYGIAANLIGEHRRTEVRFYLALARTGVDEVAESYADRVEARVSASAAQRDLAGALALLSPQDREVLLLIAWADLSYEEVALSLGIPIGTVRSRLHRARKKTRAALGGLSFGPVTVPPGRIWTMGDNRGMSVGSRFFQRSLGDGTIPVENVVGIIGSQ